MTEKPAMRGDPSMNCYNHYAYGAVADWIYRYAAGWLRIPGAESAQFSLNGVPLNTSSLAKPTTQNGVPGYEIAAGTYSFEVTEVE